MKQDEMHTAAMERVSELRRNKRDEEAIQMLRDYVAKAPKALDMWLMLGAMLMKRAENDEALLIFEQARVQLPEKLTAEVDAALGILYEAAGRKEEAIACCRASLAKDRTRIGPAMTLGLLLAESGRKDEAIALYEDLRGRVNEKQRASIDAALDAMRPRH